MLLVACLLAPRGAGARGDGADGRFERRESSHFVLYQDVDIDQHGGFRGSRRFEQQVLADLERGYDRLGALLGLRPPRKIDVVVYDPGVFDAHFAGRVRFPLAGFYNGVIAIRGATQLTVALSRVLHHELVHAALTAAAPRLILPAWLNEGVAEWFEARVLGQRQLSRRQRMVLLRARDQGALLPLASLSGPSFGRLGPHAAALAYLQAYGLVEHLARRHGEGALRDLLAELVRSGDLERSLRRAARLSSRDLEARFVADLG